MIWVLFGVIVIVVVFVIMVIREVRRLFRENLKVIFALKLEALFKNTPYDLEYQYLNGSFRLQMINIINADFTEALDKNIDFDIQAPKTLAKINDCLIYFADESQLNCLFSRLYDVPERAMDKIENYIDELKRRNRYVTKA